MNRQDHLIVCLFEECAEIIQAISKTFRFGLHNYHPETFITNAEDIEREVMDLVAVVQMLQDEGVLSKPSEDELARAIEAKKSKVEHYISRYVGLTEPGVSEVTELQKRIAQLEKELAHERSIPKKDYRHNL